MKLSVALSGGGARAALFDVGVLQCLADNGVNRSTVSIASVSGGSITNGFVGQQLDFATCTGDEFRSAVSRPLVRQLSRHGTLFAPRFNRLFLLLLLVCTAASLVAPWFLAGLDSGWKLLIVVVALIATASLAYLRGPLCRWAFRRTLFHGDESRPTRLADMHDGVDHVICATDLESGLHVFFTSDMIYGHQVGLGRPGDLDLAWAVYASAAVPPGLPPTSLRTEPYDFEGGHGSGSGRFHFVDGAVYDNMGDQWADGYRERAPRLPSRYLEREPTALVVVNADAHVGWRNYRRPPIPFFNEIKALSRDVIVMLANTTAHRRASLYRQFVRKIREESDLHGALLGIDQSPYRVADAHRHDDDARGDRARAVLALLGDDDESRAAWKQIAHDNSRVATTLNRIRLDVADRLARQGYALADCNLHVLLDTPLGPIPPIGEFSAA